MYTKNEALLTWYHDVFKRLHRISLAHIDDYLFQQRFVDGIEVRTENNTNPTPVGLKISWRTKNVGNEQDKSVQFITGIAFDKRNNENKLSPTEIKSNNSNTDR